jgi:hypothetical protein
MDGVSARHSMDESPARQEDSKTYAASDHDPMFDQTYDPRLIHLQFDALSSGLVASLGGLILGTALTAPVAA